MQGLKRHIVILLVVIFIFPLAYQPWHVLQHYSQKSNCHHDCCHLNMGHSGGKVAYSYGEDINAASEKEEPCPICNYHFPINVLPTIFHYQSNNTVAENAISDLKVRLPFQQFTSVKSPRAPPAKS